MPYQSGRFVNCVHKQKLSRSTVRTTSWNKPTLGSLSPLSSQETHVQMWHHTVLTSYQYFPPHLSELLPFANCSPVWPPNVYLCTCPKNMQAETHHLSKCHRLLCVGQPPTGFHWPFWLLSNVSSSWWTLWPIVSWHMRLKVKFLIYSGASIHWNSPTGLKCMTKADPGIILSCTHGKSIHCWCFNGKTP